MNKSLMQVYRNNLLYYFCNTLQQESSIINQVSFVLLYIVNSVNFEKNEDAIVVAQSATHALIEMCAGNYKNQIVVFKAQVVISINCILGKDSSSVNEVNW